MSDNRVGTSERTTRPGGHPSGGPAEEALVRVLPDGDARTATLLGWDGDALGLDLGDQEVAPGAVLEIEAGSVLYWGELRNRGDLGCWVKIEHSLDRAALASDRERWG